MLFLACGVAEIKPGSKFVDVSHGSMGLTHIIGNTLNILLYSIHDFLSPVKITPRVFLNPFAFIRL